MRADSVAITHVTHEDVVRAYGLLVAIIIAATVIFGVYAGLLGLWG
jgi:hypothetical protein